MVNLNSPSTRRRAKVPIRGSSRSPHDHDDENFPPIDENGEKEIVQSRGQGLKMRSAGVTQAMMPRETGNSPGDAATTKRGSNRKSSRQTFVSINFNNFTINSDFGKVPTSISS